MDKFTANERQERFDPVKCTKELNGFTVLAMHRLFPAAEVTKYRFAEFFGLGCDCFAF
jgi:hypothetical protein